MVDLEHSTLSIRGGRATNDQRHLMRNYCKYTPNLVSGWKTLIRLSHGIGGIG